MGRLVRICVGVGDPIAHSLSPALHNAGYRELGIDGEYIYLNAQVKKGDVAHVISAARAMQFRGVTCTFPHKEDVIPLIDQLDSSARAIGAVNTVVNEEGVLWGFNTDWLGVVGALEESTTLNGKKVAVIGAGGTAKAALHGILERGGTPIIFNRDLKRGEKLGEAFQVLALPLSEIAQITDCEIIINTTPVGMGASAGQSLVPPQFLDPAHTVLDSVYHPYDTKLLSDAKTIGAKVVHGIRMLLHQAFPQFEHYTKRPAPKRAMEAALPHGVS